MKSDSQLEKRVEELPPLKVKDLPVVNTDDPEAFYEVVAGLVNETKASSGVIWNSYEDLEQSALVTLRQEFPIPIFPIGPFHKYSSASSSSSLLTQDQSSISWQDNQAPKSVIYASFGSIAALNEIAWGLANSKQPFLWVVRPGLVRGSEWLEPLPSAKWVPRDFEWKGPHYQMGSTAGCASSSCFGCILDSQWLEFNIGEYL